MSTFLSLSFTSENLVAGPRPQYNIRHCFPTIHQTASYQAVPGEYLKNGQNQNLRNGARGNFGRPRSPKCASPPSKTLKRTCRLLQPAQQTSTLSASLIRRYIIVSIEIFVCDIPHHITLNANLIKQRIAMCEIRKLLFSNGCGILFHLPKRKRARQRIHHGLITIPALCLRTILRWCL